jgi:hypothetical protein
MEIFRKFAAKSFGRFCCKLAEDFHAKSSGSFPQSSEVLHNLPKDLPASSPLDDFSFLQ